MLSGLPPVSKHPNITEINHGLSYLDSSERNMFHERTQARGIISTFQRILPLMAQEMYKVPSVKKLYEERKEFDLIVVNHMFNEVSVSP